MKKFVMKLIDLESLNGLLYASLSS